MNFNMASDRLEPQPSPAETIPTIPRHGPDSRAKKEFPDWDYAQQSNALHAPLSAKIATNKPLPALSSIKSWPIKPYEALPAGEGWENLFHVLTAIGITLPDPYKPLSPTFGDRAFNELYDRTGGLFVKQALVSPALRFRVHDYFSCQLLISLCYILFRAPQ